MKEIIAWAALATLLALCWFGTANASGSPWKCTLHGAGMKTVCSAK